ncbi:hypothetical protein QYE76_043499 [Lolium multiflorum]|uniref:Uncharacterized protein n=1 Tax=Lolium multiflorum TaxID=4521 RepID=A0AAD8WXY8_LOLMU|nr:hypothetical protein QYE76_043499 [Lolium multiflorum]
MDRGNQGKTDLVDFIPHPPSRVDACAYLEEPIIMTFGEFRFGVNKEGSYRLEVPISSEFSAVDSNFSSSNGELSSPRFVDSKASGKLAKIFSTTSFESSADSFISSDSDTSRLQLHRKICHRKDMASPINFNQFLEKEKLKSNGSNFTDWFRHVRIFLNGGNLQYVLDAPLGDPPAETETDEVKNVYATRKTRYSQVQCAILCSLEADLQKRFEHHDPHELINELKTIFETHAAVECYEASKHFFSCMMEEGSSVSEHMLAMTGHAKKLSDLGIVIPNRLGINRVLQSLPPSYKNFVMNYNMQNMNKELPELFAMLKSAEIEIKKEHQVLMVNKTTSFKKQGKSKGKNKKSGKKAATPPVKPKSALSLMLSAITARRRDTGSVIAPSIWRI